MNPYCALWIVGAGAEIECAGSGSRVRRDRDTRRASEVRVRLALFRRSRGGLGSDPSRHTIDRAERIANILVSAQVDAAEFARWTAIPALWNKVETPGGGYETRERQAIGLNGVHGHWYAGVVVPLRRGALDPAAEIPHLRKRRGRSNVFKALAWDDAG